MKSKPQETRKLAWWLLKNLGAHPQEIATRLMDEGVRGFRNHPNYCPIGRYLEKNGIYGAYVTRAIYVLPCHRPDELPAEVARFREAFDAGQFPECEVQ